LGGLADLALVISRDVPFDIGFESRPPKSIEEGLARGVKALVAELVMCITDKGVAAGRGSI
jgi:hypothetical protein